MAPSTPTTGTCVHASSTVTALAADGSHHQLRLSDVGVGQRVLAVDDSRNEMFAEVVALPHSPSAESFVKITMVSSLGSKASKHSLRATLHHTFPRCGGDEAVQAKDLKPGDCLHTATGKGIVESAEPVPVAEGDVTYTIELNGADLVAVGGVFTHAKRMMAHVAHDSSQPNMEETTAHTAVSAGHKAKVKDALKKEQLLSVNSHFKWVHRLD